MKQVRIVHPRAGEATVPALSVPMWRSSGWELAGDQKLIDDAPAQVSLIANAIGYALAERGALISAADAIAAAYRVVDQTPAVTAGSDEAKDPPGNSPDGGAEPGGKQPDNEPGQDKTTPSARTRRQSSSKGDE